MTVATEGPSVVPAPGRMPRRSVRPDVGVPKEPADPDEARLVRLARAGDPAAFAALVERYHQPIHARVYRLLGDADDAADLTQDTFIKAYRALPRIDRALNVGAWLHRIATNACLDVLRRRRCIRWVAWAGPAHDALLPGSPADDPERQALSQETRAVVQRVLARMSHRHRLGLILRAYEGLSCDQVGQVMGISRSAVKSMLFRARAEFRRTYHEVTRPPTPGAPPTTGPAVAAGPRARSARTGRPGGHQPGARP